nr:DUF397 domain-containing protein [Amycolatopsis palatopharyngis]
MNMGELDGIAWRTSSYSTNGGDCVEIGHRADQVLVRDTKDRPGGALTVPRVPWHALLDQVR